MDISPELFNEIDAYIRKQMSPEERTQFEQRIQTNEELKQEVNLQLRLHVGLDAALWQQKQIGDPDTKAIQEQFAQVRFERKQRRWQQQRTYAIAAAVTCLLVSTVIILVNKFTTSAAEVAFATYYQPEPRVRSGEAIDSRFEQAQNEYYNKQYEKAVELFRQIPDDSLFQSTYYQGLAQLALTNTTDARRHFQRASQSKDPIIRYRADWYLSLTWLQANEPEQAIRVLRQIAANPQHPFREQAIQLLRDLQ